MFLAKEFAYDVYDSLNMKGVSINPNDVSTIMSASPFNLVAPKSGVVRAKFIHFRLFFYTFSIGFMNVICRKTAWQHDWPALKTSRMPLVIRVFKLSVWSGFLIFGLRKRFISALKSTSPALICTLLDRSSQFWRMNEIRWLLKRARSSMRILEVREFSAFFV